MERASMEKLEKECNRDRLLSREVKLRLHSSESYLSCCLMYVLSSLIESRWLLWTPGLTLRTGRTVGAQQFKAFTKQPTSVKEYHARPRCPANPTE